MPDHLVPSDSLPKVTAQIPATLPDLIPGSDAKPLPEVLRAPAWSRAEVLERLGGDEELLRELCEIFLTESPKLMDELRQALAEGNPEAIHRAAHSLKGELSYLAAPRATQAARRLEDMGREKDLCAAPEAIALMEGELEGLRQAIENDAAGASSNG